MSPRASTDMAGLFDVLSRELGRWGGAVDRIERAVGRVVQTGVADPSDLATLQELDALHQHLRELERFCAAIAAEPLPADADADGRRRLAAAGLNLQGLADRLAGQAEQAAPAAVVEFW
ncbi:MAG: hypothetical protein H2038_01720 [Brevundimonas sp.]|jgi:hypothetical protein|uniref:hypothetical protein n=1 Tax=Brevundimonas sp. TaxID=1871086 RepID=UPI0017EC6245|nr:hypothetical protein [Brevundimonas sp.]MBA4803349.1 hypothetical protein [Brevundimonas sp.]